MEMLLFFLNILMWIGIILMGAGGLLGFILLVLTVIGKIGE